MIAKCENCGAELKTAPVPVDGGGFDRVCSYCGARNHTAPAPPRPRPIIVAAPAHAMPTSASLTPAKRAGGCILLIVLFCVLVPVVVGVILAVKAESDQRERMAEALASVVGDPLHGGTIGVKKRPPFWEAHGSGPLVTTIAGSEAIVGRLRDIDDGDKLYVGAFDGTTAKERWKVGPFGTYIEGYRATHFAVSGAHLVVTDFHSTAHVYDRETGKEERSVTLTDRVEYMCATEPEKVWLEQVDKRAVIVDLSTGAVSDAPHPTAKTPHQALARMASPCPVEVNHEWDTEYWAKMPKIASFAPQKLFTEGSLAVVYGKKAPGTAYPIAVGVDPKTLASHWQVPIPSVDLATVRDTTSDGPRHARLHGERLVAVYGVGQKAWHLTSFDAKSGQRQWEQVLEPIFAVDSLNGLALSDTRVYVVRMDSVEVRDAATGKQLGLVGHETYESSLPH